MAAIFTERNEAEQRTETYVYVKNGEAFDKYMIDVGVNDLNYAEVKAGLKGGEEVSLEKPADELVGQTISLDGETVAKASGQLDPEDAKYDKDGDGKLSRDERRAKMMQNMSPEEINKLRERIRQRSGGGGGPRGGGGGSRGGPRGGGRN